VSAFKCSCGAHDTQDEHELDERRLFEAAVMRALIPQDRERRKFLNAVGASTASAAVASFFPLGALEALAQEKGKPEKPELKIGFIPITCATPLIMADPLGFYRSRSRWASAPRSSRCA
jgi:nitrate/nitrite transport system substrate-binding protein